MFTSGLGSVDIAVLILYIAAIISIGFIVSRRVKTVKDFTSAGQSLSPLVRPYDAHDPAGGQCRLVCDGSHGGEDEEIGGADLPGLYPQTVWGKGAGSVLHDQRCLSDGTDRRAVCSLRYDGAPAGTVFFSNRYCGGRYHYDSAFG